MTALDDRAEARMAVSQPTVDNTCVVYVAYHPSSSLARSMARLAEQVHKLCVIDNTPAGASIESVGLDDSRLRVLHNGLNLGVAMALSLGARVAREWGCGWMLTLDQDSVPNADLFAGLCRIWAASGSGAPVGCIGSSFVRLGGAGSAVVREQPLYQEVGAVISSGMLIDLAVLQCVGGFWDALFIDGVDTELCLRLRASGYRVLRSARPLLQHQIGETRSWRILGRTLYCNGHTPLRRYYIARNRILIARRHRRWFPLYQWIRDDLAAVLLEPNRKAKWRAALLGTLDGLRNVAGPCTRRL